MVYRYILCWGLFLSFTQSVFAQLDSDSAAIVQAFEDYKLAVKETDGSKVLPLLANRSLRYYDHLAGLVLFADSMELTRSPILDAVMVINLRLTVPKEELLKMDGERLAQKIFDIGKQGQGGMSAQTVGTIEYGGGVATADILLNGSPSEFKYVFYNEDGRWKIDPTAVFELSERTMQELLEANNLPLSKFLALVVRNQYQKEMTPELWQPLRRMPSPE